MMNWHEIYQVARDHEDEIRRNLQRQQQLRGEWLPARPESIRRLYRPALDQIGRWIVVFSRRLQADYGVLGLRDG